MIVRLGNVFYWTAVLAGLSWFGFWLFAFARNGGLYDDPIGSLALCVIPAAAIYGLGWAIRYVLAGKKGI